MKKADLEKYSDPIVNVYTKMEHDMLVNMGMQLKDKKDLLNDDPEAWRLQQLQNLGILDKRNLQIIRDHADMTSSQLNGLLYGAGLEGMNDNEEAIKKATNKGAHIAVPLSIGRSAAIHRILTSYENQARSTLNLTNAALIQNSKDVYKDIINRTTLQAMSGTITGEEALRSTIRQWGENGIPALITSDGKRLGTEGYVRTVITSTANNVTNDMQAERMKQYAVETIEITSHAGNRPGCVPYAGKIFSLNPDNKAYPYLYDPGVGRIGAPDSLFGINCGHYQFPFFPGLSIQRNFPNPEPQNSEVYEESQRQRLLERRIRKAKTQKEMMLANGDTKGAEQAGKLISARQATMRKFINDTGRTRRGYREQIVSTRDLQGAASKLPKPMPKPIPPKPVKVPKGQSIERPNIIANTIKGTGKPMSLGVQGIYDANLVFQAVKHTPVNKEFIQKVAAAKTIEEMDTIYKSFDGMVDADAVKAYHVALGKTKQWQAARAAATEKQMIEAIDLSLYNEINGNDDELVNSVKFIKGLSSDEKNHIRTYTGHSYNSMNTALRTGADLSNHSHSQEIKGLIKTLDRSPALTKNIIVNRDISMDSFEPLFGKDMKEAMMDALRGSATSKAFVIKKLENATIHDKAFLSTSYKRGEFTSRSSMEIRMHLPKGFNKGLFVETLSQFSSEAEYLLQAGLKFRIVNAEVVDKKMILHIVPTD